MATTNSTTSASSGSDATPSGPISTPLTKLLHISHPIILAGMAHTSTAPLAAAVSSAGGLGTIGGLGYSPDHLTNMMKELKSSLPEHLQKPSAHDGKYAFGVDLALPQVGGSARKTNHDYTHGQLDALVDAIIAEGARLFISAVGVPPPRVIERLHEGGVLVMNMVGHPKHAVKAFDAGVDLVCAQGGEGGGHTGDIAMSILVPACVEVARQYRPKMMNGGCGQVVAAGGIYDGRGLAAALALGATGVWVGTRFVASEEAGCSKMHKEAVVTAQYTDTIRTIVISGRPLRCRRNEWIDSWESRPDEVRALTEAGTVPLQKDMDEDKDVDFPYLMGQVAGSVENILPAKTIVDDMVKEAVECLQTANNFISGGRSSKL